MNKLFQLMLAGVVCFSFSIGLYGQDEQYGGVRKDGVIHNIAEDREVIKIGGINEPEGLDKYMKRHFDQMDRRISGLEQKIDQINAEMGNLSKSIQMQSKAMTELVILGNERTQ